MMRFRPVRTALAVAFPLVALSVVAGKASAADATPPALAASQPSRCGHVPEVRPQVALQDRTLAIQLESPFDSLTGFED